MEGERDLERLSDREWVSQLAEVLLCEIMWEMSGIALKRSPDQMDYITKQMSIVRGETKGDYCVELWLGAEETLFERMAGNMIGAPPHDREEVGEYATEFFNIICGRFVSELYYLTGKRARFLPTTFMYLDDKINFDSENDIYSVKFVSDENEEVVFSWTLPLETEI